MIQEEENMARIQYGILILVAFLGGLAGGSVSSRYIAGETALAQDEAKPLHQDQIYARKIIAQEYFLQNRTPAGPLDTELPIARAVLTTQPDGNPRLLIQDANGNPRFSVCLSEENGTTLALLDSQGRKRLLLSETGSAGPTLTLSDARGKTRTCLGIRSDGNPFLLLSDPSAEGGAAGRTIRIGLDGKDEATVSVSGAAGRPCAEMGLDSERICLSLRDFTGNTRAELGSTELAFGKDRSLKKASPQELSVEKREPSSLVLYNEKEKVLWSAP